MANEEDAATVAARRGTVVCEHWRTLLRLRAPHIGTVRENDKYAKIGNCLEPLPGEVLCPHGNENCGYVRTKWWGAFVLATEANHRDESGEAMTGGEIIGKVICPFGNEHFIVEASCGPRYCRSEVDKEELTSGTRVVLDMTTLTIMRTAPMPEVDIAVLRDQMRQVRELCELPLRHPELFRAIGVELPGVNSTGIASILFGDLKPPSLLKIDRYPKRTYREMPLCHHHTKRDRRWQWQR